MTKSETIRAFALEAEGCAYIYGATGQKCTPSYRRERAQQYPDHAAAIRENCPVLSGKQATCDGCKYNGRKAYDCAQLTRYSAKAAELELPSGASSQWNKADWAEKNTIDTLPMGRVCFLYREKRTANPMGHTGVYLGDGTCSHAKSHSAGVVHEAVENAAWTHWAMLKGMENDAPITDVEKEAEKPMYRYKVTGTKLALRAMKSKSSALLLRMATGTVVEGSPDGDWVKITYKGKTGYAMAQYLDALEAIAPPTEPDDAEKLSLLWAWYKLAGGRNTVA